MIRVQIFVYIYIIVLNSIVFVPAPLFAQVILPDSRVNDLAQNTAGLGRTAITAANGNFAVAWQDYNEYGNPVPAMPRVFVQMYAANGTPIGPGNLFNGESRNLSIWLNDYLTGNIDLEFQPDGKLLVGVEHKGLLSVFEVFIPSSETGFGLVSAAGQIIDNSPGISGVIYWPASIIMRTTESPRLCVMPNGGFLATAFGESFATEYYAVAIQQYDANGFPIGNTFFPHFNDPGPNNNHGFPDIGSNGSFHMVAWQDGRVDNMWDITAQFYNNSGLVGVNVPVNAGDAAGTRNVVPSVAMNAGGNSVVVWIDYRLGAAGEIFGQRYNANGLAVGSNFQISAGEGAIWDRPEVAMRNDGSFMVVWTDSILGIPGLEALRARTRQYDGNGNPTALPSLLPNVNIPAALANVATNGVYYYCSWLDNRLNSPHANAYIKIVGDIVNDIEPLPNSTLPASFQLAQNYPNPFNPATTIEFALPVSAPVSLRIYNVLGEVIAILVSQPLSAGEYRYSWHAGDLPAGVYFYRLAAGDFSQTRKMLLVR